MPTNYDGMVRSYTGSALRVLTGHLGQPKLEKYRTPSWQEYAACAGEDTEMFFNEHWRKAKRICVGCLVQRQCLEYALENDEQHGVWGGMTTPERQQLKKDVDDDLPLAS